MSDSVQDLIADLWGDSSPLCRPLPIPKDSGLSPESPLSPSGADELPARCEDPSDSAAVWASIRDRIREGWRAEFAPPGPDGRQAITWHPPGTWEPGR